MDIFCFVYPSAVYENHLTGIVANLLRTGATKKHSVIRVFDIDEIKMIFYTRRSNPDFEDFCRAMTAGNACVLHLEIDGDPNQLATHLEPEQLTMIYVPINLAVHEVLLKLISEQHYSEESFKETQIEFRKALARNIEHEEREFAEASLNQTKRLFQYYAAAQIAGFTVEQAFHLTREMQTFLLYQEDDRIHNGRSSTGDEDD